MARTNSGNLPVKTQPPASLLAEIEKCRHMVEQMNRKGNHKTIWHSDLERLEKELQELENKE